MIIGFLLTLIGVIAAIALISACVLAVRQVIVHIKGDQDEFDRLTLPYDVVEAMVQRDFGISPEVFELAWNDLKAACPDALPWDLYLKIKEGK